jgi:hypothetical protein
MHWPGPWLECRGRACVGGAQVDRSLVPLFARPVPVRLYEDDLGFSLRQL